MGVKARILLVDDEPDILTALSDYLEGALGAEVLTAASGPEALDLLRAGAPFDLVISDYRMPAMNGIDFLRQARQAKPDTPRILLTAFPDMQLALLAVNEAAVTRFLTKPVQPEELLALVSTILSDTRRARDARKALDGAAEALRRRNPPPS